MKRLALIPAFAVMVASVGVLAEPAPRASKKASPTKKAPAPTGAKAWLGVIISDVPDALAAHLRLKDAGAMVRNVAKGSPADKAGLARYDVIVSVEGRAVTSGDGLPKRIADFAPGQKVELAVRGAGRDKKVSVTLGQAPAAEVEYKYESAPGEDADSVLSRVIVHPPMTLRKGPKGWRWQGEVDLPEEIRKMLKSLPKPPFCPDVRVEVKRVISKTDHGRTIHVEQDGDGQITVRRTAPDPAGGKAETRKTYKNADELRRKDEEAYELYRKAKVVVNVPGMISPDKLPRLGEKDIRDAVRKALTDAHRQFRIRVWPEGGPPAFEKQIDQIIKRLQADQEALRRGGDRPLQPSGARPKKPKPSPEDTLQARLRKTLRALPPDQRKALVRQMTELIQQSLDQALRDASAGDEKAAKPKKPKE